MFFFFFNSQFTINEGLLNHIKLLILPPKTYILIRYSVAKFPKISFIFNVNTNDDTGKKSKYSKIFCTDVGFFLNFTFCASEVNTFI